MGLLLRGGRGKEEGEGKRRVSEGRIREGGARPPNILP